MQCATRSAALPGHLFAGFPEGPLLGVLRRALHLNDLVAAGHGLVAQGLLLVHEVGHLRQRFEPCLLGPDEAALGSQGELVKFPVGVIEHQLAELLFRIQEKGITRHRVDEPGPFHCNKPMSVCLTLNLLRTGKVP